MESRSVTEESEVSESGVGRRARAVDSVAACRGASGRARSWSARAASAPG